MEGQESAVVAAASTARPGINGWLLLPAIALVLGPILALWTLLAAPTLLGLMESQAYRTVFVIETWVHAALLASTVYVAIRFFAKNRNAPTLVIILMVARIVEQVLSVSLELAVGWTSQAIESGAVLVALIVFAAIWIPYFRMSRQVAVTFVS